MVTHEEMVKNIIYFYLGYNGDVFPNIPLEEDGNPMVSLVNYAVPKFGVGPAQYSGQSNNHSSEKFKVRFYGSSRLNIQTIKNEVLGLATDCDGGYDPLEHYSNAVKYINSDNMNSPVDLVKASGSYPTNIYISGLANALIYYGCSFLLDGATKDYLVQIPVSTSSYHDAELHLRHFRSGGGTDGGSIRIHGILDSSLATTLVRNATYGRTFNISGSYVEYTAPTGSSAVDENLDVTSLIDEILAVNPSATYLTFIVTRIHATWGPSNELTYNTCYDSRYAVYGYGCTSTSMIPYLTFYEVFPTTYPYWINVTNGKPEYNKNQWYIDFTFELRFDL